MEKPVLLTNLMAKSILITYRLKRYRRKTTEALEEEKTKFFKRKFQSQKQNLCCLCLLILTCQHTFFNQLCASKVPHFSTQTYVKKILFG